MDWDWVTLPRDVTWAGSDYSGEPHIRLRNSFLTASPLSISCSLGAKKWWECALTQSFYVVEATSGAGMDRAGLALSDSRLGVIGGHSGRWSSRLRNRLLTPVTCQVAKLCIKLTNVEMRDYSFILQMVTMFNTLDRFPWMSRIGSMVFSSLIHCLMRPSSTTTHA